MNVPIATFGFMLEALKEPLAVLLCQLAAVIAIAGLCGRVFKKLGQPSVVGEMAAGILLGPSVLGHVWPAAELFLFPEASLGTLGLLSQVGVLLFMFAVGLEIDLSGLRQRARTAVQVSYGGIVTPFILGTGLAWLLYREYAPEGIRFLTFSLFMGVAMSITAFPVLARILEERNLLGTSLGVTALASAAVEDVTAWTLLALVVGVAKAQSPSSAVATAAMALAFALFMLFGVRRAALKWVRIPVGADAPGKGLVSIILIGAFLSALATEAIGVHALFGAFLAGAILPKARPLREFLRDRLEYSASLYLLPIFFASTGLRTHLGLLDRAGDWLVFGSILLVAVAGKLGGVCLAARFGGVGWRESLGLGALMNTRGLLELIVLNLGLDLGILSPRIFAMMVLMALTTTAMTGPLLTLLGLGGRVPTGAGAEKRVAADSAASARP
jgi:Kef-type K+ transport system membrane component KefB